MKKIILIMCSIALASCSGTKGLFSDYERPDSLNIPSELFRDTLDASKTLASDTTNFGNTPWRQVFTDSKLQQLIEKALAENTDIKKADITIRQAEQGLKISRLAFLPQVALSPQGTISSYDFGKATKAYSIPIQAS